MKTRILLLSLIVAVSAAIRAVAVDFVVVNTNPTGPGSLAQAITDANALPGPDRVVFNIPGAGVRTIDVSNNFLPPITDPLTVDGYTQPGASPNTLATGSNAVVLIRIDGGNTAPRFSSPTGITVNAADCTIRGLMLTRFSPSTFDNTLILGGFGIHSTGDRCVIEGNFLGTDGTSTPGLGNEAGVRMQSSADYRVGGITPAARNLVGGNNMGIWATTSQRGLILGNHIGRYIPAGGNAGGSDGLANTIGIVLAGTFTDTVVGGTTAPARNFISGNTIGIRTAYTNPRSLTTDIGHNGIIQGNLIGAEPSAIAGGNVTGIELLGEMNSVGGTPPGAGNVIGSNQIGIKFSNAAGVPIENMVFGNDIVANVDTGISLVGSDNHVGSLAAGAGNHIHMNGRGIVVTGTPSQQNRILSNIIEDNSAPAPIDLNADGPTSNDFGDADTGPNRLQNFPIVVISHRSVSETSFTGELNSAPSSSFTVQLFGNLEGDEQQRLLNTQTVLTGANGFASFAAIYPGMVDAATVTATATDAGGNTSELMPRNGPAQLANISTRAVVGTGDRIMIAGFIIRSASQKRVAVRALGPSLAFPHRLPDPLLEIRDQNGVLLAKNDDWGAGGQQQELMERGLTPSSSLESAIVISLPEGNYTAQVSGAHGETGMAIVELYDLGAWPADSGRLANISTRGQVGLNDDALIGGFIVRGDAQARVIVRAIGPDLTALGVPGALQDATLELRDRYGMLLASNDDWRDGSQEEEIENTQLAPQHERDSAIVAWLFPGNSTAIVRGDNGETGLALVEFYDLTP